MTKTAATIVTDETLSQGLRFLAERDADINCILCEIGPPPLWERAAGFPTLVHIILEQQVSLASARAAFERLLSLASPLTPERFLELDDATLKLVGFSRQKIGYCRHLSASILGGGLDLAALDALDDDRARSELIKMKGIGRWTADIYLLMALRRPDVWPSGDLALAEAVRRAKGLASRLAQDELELAGELWRPWRAVAARLLWHYYLSSRKGRRVSSEANGGD